MARFPHTMGEFRQELAHKPVAITPNVDSSSQQSPVGGSKQKGNISTALVAISHQVLLSVSPGEEPYSVTVLLKPQSVDYHRIFVDYHCAGAYARLLRIQHGWPVIDHAGPPHGTR